jgi:hypothetical protein
VFAAGANAFLRIGCARGLAGNRAWPFVNVRRTLSKEDRNELVHPRVGEQQVRRIRQKTGRRHNGVPFGFKEIQE